jgi:hypothetical protein
MGIISRFIHRKRVQYLRRVSFQTPEGRDHALYVFWKRRTEVGEIKFGSYLAERAYHRRIDHPTFMQLEAQISRGEKSFKRMAEAWSNIQDFESKLGELAKVMEKQVQLFDKLGCTVQNFADAMGRLATCFK